MLKYGSVSHLSDIHIPNDLKKLPISRIGLENTLVLLKKKQSDIIVIPGDLFDKFTHPTNEAKALAGWFLNECAKISKVIITLGNHDTNLKAKNRLDSVKTVCDLINNPNVVYLNETGFFEDKNIVWSVWHHPDKMSPWVKYNNTVVDPDKVYIDLFHDPINGAKTFFGKEFNDPHYVNLKDFHGDCMMAGDIHQHRFFYKNNKLFGAYPSSLIQQNFGESVDNHGFIVWDITDKTNLKAELIEVPNEYIYINHYINNSNNDFDFDNIDINIEVREFTSVKIHWEDYSANMSKDNERKIRTHLKDKYGDKVIYVVFDKTRLNSTVIEENDYIANSIKNIDEQATQQDIFRQFLIDKKYDENFIDDVLKLDNIITNRLQLSNDKNSFDYEILKIWVDNYRSHGDRSELNWENRDGIWQINGLNGVGKTNLISAIAYLHYGVILETKKKEKFGDNRFINNKRDLDYCEVGAIERINGVKYKIVRRTERVWDKTGTKITGTPTTVNYYMLDENENVVDNLNDVEKTKTQKIVEASIGTFDDFLRTSLVSADTLNSLLSMDESVFMDSLLRDSGLDIFEKKLAEYKEYKKETYKKEEKIVLDVLTEEQVILDNLQVIDDKKKEIVEIEKAITLVEERISKGTEIKEAELKKLQNVDQALSKLSVEGITNDINKLLADREQKLKDIELLQSKIDVLKSEFDTDSYNKLLKSKDDKRSSISDLKQSVKNNRSDKDNTIQKISIINGEVITINREITSINGLIESEKKLIQGNIDLKEKEIINEYVKIDNKINNIKKEIDILEKSKICPSCNRELDGDGFKHILSSIELKKEEIVKLEESKKDNAEVSIIQAKINVLKEELISGNDKIKSLLTDITKKEALIIAKEESKITISKEVDAFDVTLITIEKNIGIKNEELTLIEEDIIKIDLEKKEVEQRQLLINEQNNIPLQIEVIDLKIEKNKKTFEDYNKNQAIIAENEKIQKVIDKYTQGLVMLDGDRQEKKNQISFINNSVIKQLVDKNIYISDRITKFKKQEKEELVNKVYTECIHRDGLPKIILLKMRDDINEELNAILCDVDFSIYFDEEMVLKMYHNVKPESIQNVISGSGYERTFISVVLRLALRSINNKSLGNFLFLDEITGKLVDASVPKFFDLIHKMKRNIQKIVIIEHAYAEELHPDHVIDVTLDERGVSSFELVK